MRSIQPYAHSVPTYQMHIAHPALYLHKPCRLATQYYFRLYITYEEVNDYQPYLINTKELFAHLAQKYTYSQTNERAGNEVERKCGRIQDLQAAYRYGNTLQLQDPLNPLQ